MCLLVTGVGVGFGLVARVIMVKRDVSEGAILGACSSAIFVCY